MNNSLHPLLSDRLLAPYAAPTRSSGGDDAAFSIDPERTGALYTIRNEIPRFVEDESFVASFGFQWSQFEVHQASEDARTLAARVGVPLDKLAGLTVLDAGCGGGRYSRVAAEHGAAVVGVDRSRAVDRAQRLCSGLENVAFVQADLCALPFRPQSFDLVFSIGVLHHSPDAQAAFRSIARMVQPGGRLSVWLYRRNTWVQERINDLVRAAARRLSRRNLLSACRAAALVGGLPVLNRTLNKIVNFSNHPRWENRVCDNFDWYAPVFQSHHTVAEVAAWFTSAGFDGLCELPPLRAGRGYRIAHDANLIVGSGVNLTGVKS